MPKVKNRLERSGMRPCGAVSGEPSPFSAFSMRPSDAQLTLLTATIFWYKKSATMPGKSRSTSTVSPFSFSLLKTKQPLNGSLSVSRCFTPVMS